MPEKRRPRAKRVRSNLVPAVPPVEIDATHPMAGQTDRYGHPFNPDEWHEIMQGVWIKHEHVTPLPPEPDDPYAK